MPSINVDLHFFSHKKTMRLSAQLGDQAVTCLIRLWCYVGQHYPDTGSLGDMKDFEIEHISQWKGESGLFIRVLVSIGLIDIIDGCAHIHGWNEHAKHLIVYKERSKKAAHARWASRAVVESVELKKIDASCNASSMLEAFSPIEKSISYASCIASSNAKSDVSIVPIHSNTSHSNTKNTKNKKPRKFPWPNDLSVTDELIKIAQEKGFDPYVEFEAARDHCLAHAKQYSDYAAFLRNWFRNDSYAKKKIIKPNSYSGSYHKKVQL